MPANRRLLYLTLSVTLLLGVSSSVVSANHETKKTGNPLVDVPSSVVSGVVEAFNEAFQGPKKASLTQQPQQPQVLAETDPPPPSTGFLVVIQRFFQSLLSPLQDIQVNLAQQGEKSEESSSIPSHSHPELDSGAISNRVSNLETDQENSESGLGNIEGQVDTLEGTVLELDGLVKATEKEYTKLSVSSSLDVTGTSNLSTTNISGVLKVGDTITSGGSITFDASSFVRIGDSSAPGHSTGDTDLYVQGKLEVDSSVDFGTSLSVTGDTSLASKLTAANTSVTHTFGGVTVTGSSIVIPGTTKLAGVTYTWPSSVTNGNFLTTDGNGTLSWSAVSGGDTTAQYLTLATSSTLTNERVLTAGSGISISDAGAGGALTVSASGGSSQWTTTGASIYYNIGTGASYVGIGTSSPSYTLDVVGTGNFRNLLSHNLTFSSSNSSLLKAQVGHNGYTNFNGGIGTGGVDSVTPSLRMTNTGNLVNLGSIQGGELDLSKAGTFAARVNYTTATGPRGVAMGDVSGDGKADVVATSSSHNISVLINNGSGTFATKVDYATGSTPYSVAIGDLNGDGKADIAVVNFSSSTVSVFINNGSGTFATKVDYTTGSNPYAIAIGDLNGDGKADLVVGNNSATISVLINNGSGTFATKVDYTANSQARGIAIGDLNGDGKADLAVASLASTSVSVFINNGDGTFATKVDYTAGSQPYAIAIGDLNGDGKTDLAVLNHNSTSFSVFINNGDGTFAAKVDYTTGSLPYAIAIGDLNGDGKADMAVTNEGSNSVSVFINNGDGTFAAKVDYTTGSFPYGVARGDVDGDGKADLVVANNGAASVSVFINNKVSMIFASGSTGNVGIGTTAPSVPFEVKAASGTIAKFTSNNSTGCTLADGGTISCSSDATLKKDITTIDSGLTVVNQLRPVVYRWNHQTDDSLSHGFIAQEVESVLPGLVSTDSLTGLKSLNTAGITPYLVAAVKEQQVEIDALTSKISSGRIGSAVLSSGTTEIDVAASMVTSGSKIFITASGEISTPLFVLSKTPGVGFRVKTTTPPTTDVEFSWWVVETD